MLLFQKWPFFKLFPFLGNIGQENVRYDIQEKNSSLGYENKKYKKSRI